MTTAHDAARPSTPTTGVSDTTDRTASNRSNISVLVVDDDPPLREACTSYFQAEGFSTVSTGSGMEALELVKRRRFDLVLLDLYMTQVLGMEVLRAAIETHKDVLVAVMTGNPSVESNREAFREGAWDYLLKPFTPTHLDVLTGRAVHAILALREQSHSVGGDGHDARSGNSDLVTCIGTSTSFRQAVELARRVAPTDASVMLSGESGTGKEVLAQVIHLHSRRGTRRLVPINCAALPEALLESEMFGHKKGSFTGAERDKPGLLEVANQSTLFLDELTEMSQRIQAKLLRVLQDGVVRRVGSEHQETVDVRFISATNRDPHEAMSSGVLREDLFYRLRVVLIKLPPLRQRVQDIPLLAEHFLSYYWRRHRQRDAPAPKFAPASMELLKSKRWPGNVRELQNVIEHLAVLAEPGQLIRPDDIPFYEEVPASLSGPAIPPALLEEGYYTAREKLVANFERAYLGRLVDRSGGNMSKAARIASIDRTTLYRLLDRYSVKRNELDDPPRAD